MKCDKSLDQINLITETILGCAFRVANTLGPGFLEKVYENSLAYDIHKSGLLVRQQHPIPVYYDGVIVGDYFADLIIEDCVILELKAIRALDDVHMAQCLNYLKATGLRVCLLINFGKPRIDYKRIIL
jgi:GxxExxY protein